MQKPESDDQALPPGVLPMKEQQKKYNIQGYIKTLLERDCEVKLGSCRDFDIIEKM